VPFGSAKAKSAGGEHFTAGRPGQLHAG